MLPDLGSRDALIGVRVIAAHPVVSCRPLRAHPDRTERRWRIKEAASRTRTPSAPRLRGRGSVGWRGSRGLGSLPDQDRWRKHDDAIGSGCVGAVCGCRRRRRRGWGVEGNVRIHRYTGLVRREVGVYGIGGSGGSGYRGRGVCSRARRCAGARARIAGGGVGCTTCGGSGDKAGAQRHQEQAAGLVVAASFCPAEH